MTGGDAARPSVSGSHGQDSSAPAGPRAPRRGTQDEVALGGMRDEVALGGVRDAGALGSTHDQAALGSTRDERAVARRVDLLGWITEQLRQDQRVRGLWITGSTARGTADAFSDLDLVEVVNDDGPPASAFVDSWLTAVRQAMPLVYHQVLDFGPTVVVNHIVGDDWLRFDLLVGPPDVLRGRSRRTAKVVFDRDGLDNSLPVHGPVVGPSADVVAKVVPEFLRVAALLPVALGREDYVVAASGSTLLRTMLIQLMVESVEVEDRGGALHLSTLLSPQHYSALGALPPIATTRESAIDFQRACLDAFLPLAQHLCRRTGVTWPDEFATAVRRRLEPVFADGADGVDGADGADGADRVGRVGSAG